MRKFLAVALTGTLISFVAFGTQAKEKAGELSKTSNVVQVKQDEKFRGWKNVAQAWKAGSQGAELFDGNVVRTGLRSAAEIKYNDGTVTRVGSRSAVLVKGKNLSIKKGYIWGKVAKQTGADKFRIFTGNAIASIFGTEFFVEVNRDQSTVVTVLEGYIRVTGKDREVMVTGGNFAVVDKEGNVSKPAPLNQSEVLKRYADVVQL